MAAPSRGTVPARVTGRAYAGKDDLNRSVRPFQLQGHLLTEKVRGSASRGCVGSGGPRLRDERVRMQLTGQLPTQATASQSSRGEIGCSIGIR
jgi:hypothetical protein